MVAGCPWLPLREVLDPAVVPSAADTTSGGGWRCQEESEKGTWVDVMGNLGADHGVFECERSFSKTEEVFYEGQKYSTAGEVLVPKHVSGKAVKTRQRPQFGASTVLHSTNGVFSLSHQHLPRAGEKGQGCESSHVPWRCSHWWHVALKETWGNFLD